MVRQAAGTMARAPTEKMIGFARRLARARGSAFPRAWRRTTGVSFLDAHALANPPDGPGGALGHPGGAALRAPGRRPGTGRAEGCPARPSRRRAPPDARRPGSAVGRARGRPPQVRPKMLLPYRLEGNGDGSGGWSKRFGGSAARRPAMPAPLPIRADRGAPALCRPPVASGTDGSAPACSRWPTRWRACPARRRHGSPARPARRSVTGSTATTRKVSAACATGPRPGRPRGLDEGQQAALKALVLRGPRLKARRLRVAWRLRDLCDLVERRFGGATARVARCGWPRASTSPGRRRGRSTPGPTRGRRPASGKLARGDARGRRPAPEAERVELWFEDEARIGQKGRVTHVWHQKASCRAGCASTGSPRPSSSARSAPSGTLASPSSCPRSRPWR